MIRKRDYVGYAGTPPQARWPGNARIALQFVINYEEGAERSIEFGDAGAERLNSDNVGASGADGASLTDLSVKRRTEALERSLIAEALERTGGNRTRAAQLLELSHRALLYKIRDYGLGE